MTEIRKVSQQLKQLQKQLKSLADTKGIDAKLAEAIGTVQQHLTALDGGQTLRPGSARRGGDGSSTINCNALYAQFGSLLALIDATEVKPTTQVLDAVKKLRTNLATLQATWQDHQKTTLPGLNKRLQEAKLPMLKGL